MISRKMTQCGLNLNWPFIENYFLEDFNDFEVFFFCLFCILLLEGFFRFVLGFLGFFFGGGGGGVIIFFTYFYFFGKGMVLLEFPLNFSFLFFKFN